MTTSPWPTSVFGIPVIKDEIGTAGLLKRPVNIVLHTTEGPEDSDPRPTFKARGDAPHFAVSARNGGTIWQLRSLDQWAAALRHGTIPPGQDSPNAHAVQIEICGYTGDGNGAYAAWSLSPLMLRLTAAAVAYMAQHHAVPLAYPNPAWKDDCSDMPHPWAVNNARRKWAGFGGNWPNRRGVWGHVDVPWQDPTWHYDPGALNRTQIINAAKALLEPPPPPNGGDMAGEADKIAAATLKALDQHVGDASGNDVERTGKRYGYRGLPLPAYLAANKDAMAGHARGTAQRAADGYTGD